MFAVLKRRLLQRRETNASFLKIVFGYDFGNDEYAAISLSKHVIHSSGNRECN